VNLVKSLEFERAGAIERNRDAVPINRESL